MDWIAARWEQIRSIGGKWGAWFGSLPGLRLERADSVGGSPPREGASRRRRAPEVRGSRRRRLFVSFGLSLSLIATAATVPMSGGSQADKASISEMAPQMQREQIESQSVQNIAVTLPVRDAEETSETAKTSSSKRTDVADDFSEAAMARIRTSTPSASSTSLDTSLATVARNADVAVPSGAHMRGSAATEEEEDGGGGFQISFSTGGGAACIRP